MADRPSLKLEVVSDIVCPWCYIGKKRLGDALTLTADIDVDVRWRPFFLNPWIPREGVDRKAYLEAKWGSVERYRGIAANVAAAAAEEGLSYDWTRMSRQPNTIDCHRLIRWGEASGRSGAIKQRLMELYFSEGGDLTDTEVLVRAAADCGMDADDVRSRLATDLDVEAVAGEEQAAANAGVSGVPTFLFDGRYALSGAYPADQLAQAIRQIATSDRQQAS